MRYYPNTDIFVQITLHHFWYDRHRLSMSNFILSVLSKLSVTCRVNSLLLLAHFLAIVPGLSQTHSFQDRYAKNKGTHFHHSPADGSFYLVQWKTVKRTLNCVHEIRLLDEFNSIVSIAECADTLPEGEIAAFLPVNDLWKLSPKLEHLGINPFAGTRPYIMAATDTVSFNRMLLEEELDKKVISKRQHFYLIHLSHEELGLVIASPHIYFVDQRSKPPQAERALNDLDLCVNQVDYLHQIEPDLLGAGQIISLKETLFDLDIDFLGRYSPSALAPAAVTTHATNMATMLVGAGNSDPGSQGVASRAYITVTDFLHLLPDPISHFQSSGATVQNHSYGLEIENYYGPEAQAYDQQVYDHPYLVHVFSAGNYGDSTSRSGQYENVPGYANLTGTFKMAKNVLVVGAVDTTVSVVPRSSRGPTFDGRIKPDLVAYGQDGSSGSAAITSGLVSLMQEAYHNQYQQLPDAALIKALLISSAEDIHRPGPDFLSGFGNIHAARTLENLERGNFFLDEISAGQIKEFELEIPHGTSSLNITLTWTDPASSLNTHRALVNDLDLALIDPSGKEWKPWVLNTRSQADSLAMPAVRGLDSLNNSELISLNNPIAGTYKFTVEGRLIQNGNQRFSAAFSSIPKDHFRWTHPSKQSILKAGDPSYLRWDCTYEDQAGQVEYKPVSGQDWQLLDSVVSLTIGHFLWRVPKIFSPAQVRMVLTDTIFTSDTFMISPTPRLTVGFDCIDSLLLFWTGIDSAASFQLLGLGNEKMELIGVLTPDTLTVLSNHNSTRHFSVEPLHPLGFRGARSRTINVDFQATGCYVDNFLADLEEDQVRLRLWLGTDYGVEEVFFEKLIDGVFTRIYVVDEAKTMIEHRDVILRDGANIYRAGVRLISGQIIFSDEQLIRYTSKDFLIVPNPVYRNNGFSIISKRVEDYEIHLYDFLGRSVLSEELFSRLEYIDTERLSPGIYFYTITNAETALTQGVLLLQ